MLVLGECNPKKTSRCPLKKGPFHPEIVSKDIPRIQSHDFFEGQVPVAEMAKNHKLSFVKKNPRVDVYIYGIFTEFSSYICID